MKDTTVKIDAARREVLKDAAFKVSMETREMTSMTDVLRFLVDNYTEEAITKMTEDSTTK